MILSNAILSFISVTYTINEQNILDNVSFDIIRGDFVFMFGHTGSGKSTLLDLIAAKSKPSQGQIQVLDNNLSQIAKSQIPYYRRKLGISTHDLRLSPHLTIAQNLLLVLDATGWKDKVQKQARIQQLLRLLKISPVYDQYPLALNQIDYTKVLLARAIINQPPILLLDDITRGLDARSKKEILFFIKGYSNDNGTTVLFFTSDKDLPLQYPSDTVLICQENTIQALSPA